MAGFRTIASLGSLGAFRDYLHELVPELDCVEEIAGSEGPLAQAAEVNGLHIGNRLVCHPMEGWDATASGLPSEYTLRRWRNFGRSGCKLVWGGEAFAVQQNGRANPNQLFLNDDQDVLGGLRALRQEVLVGHAESGLDEQGLVIGLQLTHSGRWSRPSPAGPAPRTACRHLQLDPRVGIDDDSCLLDDSELAPLAERYADAAQLAQGAGFDFVDVKVCHGYLLHEFLAARERPGPYGGDFAGRTRLFREIVAAIRARCPDLEIGVRVSIADVFPHQEDPASGLGAPTGMEQALPYHGGFGVDAQDPLKHDWEEPFAFLELLQELGIRLVNLTLSSPYWCPHLTRPAAYPPSDGYQPPEDPLLSVTRQLRAARHCKAHFPELFLIGTGYTYLQEYLAHVAEHEVGHGHVDAVGVGRMLLSYPEFPLHVLNDQPLQFKRLCRTFSDCTSGPRNGMRSGCFPLDPYYRAMPEAQQLRLARKRRMDTV